MTLEPRIEHRADGWWWILDLPQGQQEGGPFSIGRAAESAGRHHAQLAEEARDGDLA